MKRIRRTICMSVALIVAVGAVVYMQSLFSAGVEVDARLEYHQSDLVGDSDIILAEDREIVCNENGSITILADSANTVTIRKNGTLRTGGAGTKTSDGIKRAIKVDVPNDVGGAQISITAKSGGNDERYIAVSDGQVILNALGEVMEGSKSGQMTDIPAHPDQFTMVKSELLYGEGTYYIYSTSKSVDITDISVTWVSDGSIATKETSRRLSAGDLAELSPSTLTQSVEGIGTSGGFSILATEDHEVEITADGQIRTRYTGNISRNSVRISIPDYADVVKLTVTGCSSGDTEKYLFINDGNKEINLVGSGNKVSDMVLPKKSEGPKSVSSPTQLTGGVYYIYSKNGGCYINDIVVNWTNKR